MRLTLSISSLAFMLAVTASFNAYSGGDAFVTVSQRGDNSRRQLSSEGQRGPLGSGAGLPHLRIFAKKQNRPITISSLSNAPLENADEDVASNDASWKSPHDDVFRSFPTQKHDHQHTVSNGNNHQIANTHLHVILFQQGTSQEGVHTIEYPKDSGSNVILAFESSADCMAFAKILGNQMQLEPMPREIPTRNLQTYASSLGITVQVIPSGMRLKPPKSKVSAVSVATMPAITPSAAIKAIITSGAVYTSAATKTATKAAAAKKGEEVKSRMANQLPPSTKKILHQQNQQQLQIPLLRKLKQNKMYLEHLFAISNINADSGAVLGTSMGTSSPTAGPPWPDTASAFGCWD